jgi:hypothetical protein
MGECARRGAVALSAQQGLGIISSHLAMTEQPSKAGKMCHFALRGIVAPHQAVTVEQSVQTAETIFP